MSVLLHASYLEMGYHRGQTTIRLLQDLNLSLAGNEVVVVAGASGVGKSSLLRILVRLEKSLVGEVNYLGQPPDGPHPHLSVVFQDPTLLPWRILEQNVAFGLDFRHQPRLEAHERQERVRQAIASVSLITHLSKLPTQLSGGMVQHVASARCLAWQPRVMLLDEPFSALDEVTRHDMQRLLITVLNQHRMPALLVTHDIDEVLLVADRAILPGGALGRLMGEWRPQTPHPCDDALETLAALRLDILKKLCDVRADTDAEKRYVLDVWCDVAPRLSEIRRAAERRNRTTTGNVTAGACRR